MASTVSAHLMLSCGHVLCTWTSHRGQNLFVSRKATMHVLQTVWRDGTHRDASGGIQSIDHNTNLHCSNTAEPKPHTARQQTHQCCFTCVTSSMSTHTSGLPVSPSFEKWTLRWRSQHPHTSPHDPHMCRSSVESSQRRAVCATITLGLTETLCMHACM